MVRSNAIEIVCGDLYSAKVNFAGDRPYSDPYMSFSFKLDGEGEINTAADESYPAIDIENTGRMRSTTINLHAFIAVNGRKISDHDRKEFTSDDTITVNIPIVDGVVEIPDILTDWIIPTRTDYDIFVSVPTGDSSTGHYTPVYRNVIEFLPRTNKIL